MDFEADRTLDELRTLRRAVIDSSSIIYAEKAGIIDTLVSAVELVTVVAVFNEVGHTIASIRALNGPNRGAVDGQVVELAQAHGLPIISEDRKLLSRAAERDLHGYNMLVILELLLFRGLLRLPEWDNARKHLLAAAHYHPRVVHAGNELHWAVRKEIG